MTSRETKKQNEKEWAKDRVMKKEDEILGENNNFPRREFYLDSVACLQ